ncbi:hypothetical protein CYMTET_31315, partial [Cymbomonas tetramitiformis]
EDDVVQLQSATLTLCGDKATLSTYGGLAATTGEVRVQLVAMVHVGDGEYYSTIQKQLVAPADRCLVECITSESNLSDDGAGRRRLLTEIQPTPEQRQLAQVCLNELLDNHPGRLLFTAKFWSLEGGGPHPVATCKILPPGSGGCGEPSGVAGVGNLLNW